MDIYELIRNCKTDEELEKLANAAIDICNREGLEKNKNYGVIGVNIGINPLHFNIDENGVGIKKYYNVVNIWNSYIPRGMKIVYAGSFDENFKSYTNEGHYYYLDDESYILKFYKYIRELKLEDEYDLIIAMHEFLRALFATDSTFNVRTREDVNKVLYQSNGLFFDPVKEHSIKDFYGNGSAECTEMASVGENLLCALGFNAIYVQDKGHAYNIVYYGEEEKHFYIVDFANWVAYYDEKYRLVDTCPFYKRIEGATFKDLDLMANEGKRFSLDDYYFYEIGGKTLELTVKTPREYGAEYSNIEDKPLNIKKIKHI